MRRRPISALALVALAGLVASACASASADVGDGGSSLPPSGTIGGVGVLPDPVRDDAEPIVVIQRPTNADGEPVEPVAEAIDGNRVLLIGDSIFASTSARYADEMCKALVPLGWQAQVEAEPSRFVEFGNQVLDRVLDDPAGWNAAVVFLGSNYDGDAAAYERQMRTILERLAPRPVVLLTVTEYRANYAEVNEVVRRLGDEYEHVVVLDWKAIAQTPGVLSGDRLHPSDRGRTVLAESVAATLGPVSIGDGACLSARFRDDSASTGGGGATPTKVPPRPTRPTTTTTSPGGTGTGTTTTAPSSGTATTTVPSTATTAPATTAAPTTAAPPTDPPAPPPEPPDEGGSGLGDGPPADGATP